MAVKLGDRIRVLRDSNPTYSSLRHFAEALGKSPSWVSKVERGLEVPGTDTLLQIAELLGAEADELLELAHRLDPEVERKLAERYTQFSGLLRTIKDMAPDQIEDLERRAKLMKREGDGN